MNETRALLERLHNRLRGALALKLELQQAMGVGAALSREALWAALALFLVFLLPLIGGEALPEGLFGDGQGLCQLMADLGSPFGLLLLVLALCLFGLRLRHRLGALR